MKNNLARRISGVVALTLGSGLFGCLAKNSVKFEPLRDENYLMRCVCGEELLAMAYDKDRIKSVGVIMPGNEKIYLYQKKPEEEGPEAKFFREIYSVLKEGPYTLIVEDIKGNVEKVKYHSLQCIEPRQHPHWAGFGI